VDSTQAMPRADCTRCLLLSDGVPAPVAFCSADGAVESATPLALTLLERMGVGLGDLPRAFWSLIERCPAGEAMEWCTPEPYALRLGFTRYAVEGGGYLLFLRELQERPTQTQELPARQRIESTHRLVASVAHDLRGSVASLVYSADFLESNGATLRRDTFEETVHDIRHASRRLQLTVDGLLDYARLGPTISVPVSLPEVTHRAQRMLNSFYRDELHRVRLELSQDAEWVRGNPIAIEQIFVNLLLHAAERADAPRLVTISSSPVLGGAAAQLYLRVSDDGPGVAQEVWDSLFRPEGAAGRFSGGLALAEARAAAESQGGRLLLETSHKGSAFALFLPRSEGPRCAF
jgi:signal transduction histidine kinase